MTFRHVHVVGAGLAGLAAAVRLVERGVGVTLHEAAPAAGGRCRSYFDRELGCRIDNGNHLLLSGNRAAFASSSRSAAATRWPGRDGRRSRSSIWRAASAGRCGRTAGGCRGGSFAGPAGAGHAGGGLSAVAALRRAAVGRDGGRDAAAGPAVSPVAGAVRDRGAQHDAGDGERAAALGRDGREPGARAGEPASPPIRPRGCRRRSSTRRCAGSRRAAPRSGSRSRIGSLETGTAARVTAGWMAKPSRRSFWRCRRRSQRRWCRGSARRTRSKSILNVHFRVEADPGEAGFVGFVGGMAEWVFVKPGVVSVTISAGNRFVTRESVALAQQVWQEVSTALRTDGADAAVSRVKGKRATFAATPEQERQAARRRVVLANLVLAGDWTATGLPATIEGAIRSGRRAAETLLDHRTRVD